MRRLTDSEIEFVLKDIVPRKSEFNLIWENIVDKIRDNYRTQLKSIEIYPEMINSLKERFDEYYINSQICPGESVGILTAQSIGERQTQLTLNTFHTAGSIATTVLTGVPRFRELLNATKTPKGSSTIISTIEKYDSYISIKSATEHLLLPAYLGKILDSHKIITEPKIWYICPVNYPHAISLKFIPNKLFAHNLTLCDIAERISQEFEDCQIIVSPISLATIDIWTNDLSIIKKMKSMLICGVAGLEEIQYSQNNGWNIIASGYNMRDLMSIPWIDASKTYSNHMWEICSILGIEATREFLIEEFKSIISNESYLNLRHIQLLVDVMTYTGSISSISRFGVHRNQSGPITKATFEETLDNFLKAGLNAEVETTNGVSAAIVCGKPVRAGTGICELLYDI